MSFDLHYYWWLLRNNPWMGLVAIFQLWMLIDAIRRDYGFEPETSIDEGVPRFVEWYRDFYEM